MPSKILGEQRLVSSLVSHPQASATRAPPICFRCSSQPFSSRCSSLHLCSVRSLDGTCRGSLKSRPDSHQCSPSTPQLIFSFCQASLVKTLCLTGSIWRQCPGFIIPYTSLISLSHSFVALFSVLTLNSYRCKSKSGTMRIAWHFSRAVMLVSTSRSPPSMPPTLSSTTLSRTGMMRPGWTSRVSPIWPTLLARSGPRPSRGSLGM